MFPILKKLLRAIWETTSPQTVSPAISLPEVATRHEDAPNEEILHLMRSAQEHYQAGRFLDAEKVCGKIIQTDPDHAASLNLLGLIFDRAGKSEIAVEYLDRARRHDPSNPTFLVNLGDAYNVLRRYDEAIACCDSALALKVDCAEAFNTRGTSLIQLNRHDEALESFVMARTLKPDFSLAYFNESKCRLLLGDFERGWPEYEWRWKCDEFFPQRRNFAKPIWLGKEDIFGKTVFVHAEQGLGDTIQFARYTQLLAQKGARVILEVWRFVTPLLSDIPGAHQVVGAGDPLPEFDVYCPLLSLPLAFGTRLETIPASIPYLYPSATKAKAWEDKLHRGNTINVGIVWSGRPQHKNDRNRSLPLRILTALADPQVQLISLQKELRPGDAKVLDANKQILHFGPELEDFSDTAALVANMDLVISVDTSIAHLAGAMGKPVWILLPFAPDWRWLLDREDSPWYPTARLFRQPKIGDWDGVISKVKHALSDFCRTNPMHLNKPNLAGS